MKKSVSGLSDELQSAFVIQKRLYGSLLNSARQNLSASGGLDGREFMKLARSIVGDVMVCTNDDNQDEVYIASGKETIQSIIDKLVYSGGKVHLVDIQIKDKNGGDITDQKIKTMPKYCSYNPIDITISSSETFTAIILAEIEVILTKLDTKATALSATEKNLINSLPYNGYVIINLLHANRGEIDKKEFAEFIALMNLKPQFEMIFSETLRIASELTSKLSPDVESQTIYINNLTERIKSASKESEDTFRAELKPYFEKFGKIIKEKEKVLKDRVKK